MNENEIEVVWNQDGREQTLTVDEKVFPDPTCGQWEGGWVVFNPHKQSEEYFVSLSGVVYGIHSSIAIGVAPAIAEMQEELEEREALIDRAYALEVPPQDVPRYDPVGNGYAPDDPKSQQGNGGF